MSDIEPITPSEPTPAYRFRDENMEVVHTASLKNDEVALEYFEKVQGWFPDISVRFVERRDEYVYDWHFIPYEFDGEKVNPL